MKRKNQLVDKLEKFYMELQILKKYLKGDTRYFMRLQTDQEFHQNKIKEINKKQDVEQCNTKLNEGHAVGMEQKTRELKERFKNVNRTNKQNKKSRFKPNKALIKVTANMNLQPRVKYRLPPSKVKKKLASLKNID